MKERSDKVKNKAKEGKVHISLYDLEQSCAATLLAANNLLQERLKDMSEREIRECIASTRKSL